MDRHGSRPHFSICRATSVDREREFGGVRGGGFVLVGSAVEVSVFVACGVVLVVSLVGFVDYKWLARAVW